MTDSAQLQATVNSLVHADKGILAADESGPTIARRFKSIAAEATEESRRAYRSLLVATPGLGAFISGIILYDADADAALSGFQRFPAWMWRNTVVRDFVDWLRDYNTGLSPLRQVGFYGLDLYSLFASIQAVLTYLDKVDPQAARCARYRYACFNHAAPTQNARATISTPAWPSGSMPSYTSTRPAQWSRRTWARCGATGRRRRRFRQAFSHYCKEVR